MNFTGKMEGPEIQVELKYCERCGGLWLRPQGADGVYCAGCRVFLAALPSLDVTPRKARRRKARVGGGAEVGMEDSRRRGRIERLEGVGTVEVWA